MVADALVVCPRLVLGRQTGCPLRPGGVALVRAQDIAARRHRLGTHARLADQAAERLWERMAGRLNRDQLNNLKELLERTPDSPFSNLEVLHRSVLRQSGPGLVEALSRYDRLCSLGVGEVDLSGVPAARIRSLAQQAVVRSPATLRNWSEPHLLGTLLAFARVYETRALDDALDLFDVVMMSVFKTAEAQGQEWQ